MQLSKVQSYQQWSATECTRVATCRSSPVAQRRSFKPSSQRDVQYQRMRHSSCRGFRPSPPGCRESRIRCPQAASGDGDSSESSEGPFTNDRSGRLKLLGVAVTVAAGVAFYLTTNGYQIEDALYGDGLYPTTLAGLSIGGVVAGTLWSAAYWFCTPLQLLLLFLGRIDVERPSDWLSFKIGQLARLPVEDVGYSVPSAVWALTAGITVTGGVGTAWLLDASLGDATWAVSTGIGACMAAGVYEVGRPKRYSSDETAEIDSQWRDFTGFANQRLQRTGRCHESEVFAAFRKEMPKYRSPDMAADEQLRDFVRSWSPTSTRSRSGYLKGISVSARMDPFSGQLTGSTSAVQAAVADAEVLQEGRQGDAAK